MSGFSDEDLKRLKEQCFVWQQEDEDSTYEVTVSPSKIEALLTRLEAAEQFCGRMSDALIESLGPSFDECSCSGHLLLKEFEAWRKAAGE